MRWALSLLFLCVWQPAFGQVTTPPPVAVTGKAHCKGSQPCRLGDTLYVGFDNLPAFAANRPQDLVLVLDDRVMAGLKARGPNAQNNTLAFDLKRLSGDSVDAKANQDAWNALLSRSKSEMTMTVSVAAGGNPPYLGAAPIEFKVLPDWSFVIGVAFVLFVAGFVWLGRASDMLRDGPTPAGGGKLSYSLGRCQMAWWTIIVVAAFVYIWIVTGGDFNFVPTGVLILMGISSATAMGSMLVDSNRKSQRQPLLDEQAALAGRLVQLTAVLQAAPPPPDALDLQAERGQKLALLAAVQTQLASLPSPPDQSEGFFKDILRDETGVSLHRWQMAVWTVVLGVVFGAGVYTNLAMPDFNATLLTLMGISSGSYVGFKIPDPPK
jgi:hypothetical protein